MISTIIGKKLGQTQGFLSDGTRIPMTRIDVSSNVVTQLKTSDHDGYESIQLGFGENKKADKPTTGHSKKAGLIKTPRFFRETRVDKVDAFELGAEINVEEVLTPGDIVDVIGTSKGKGFAGVVKRHHFKGGPKTHGQSDRHRAPGSIGQSTTPGRVYKGKRMAGRMGDGHVTVKNLEVIEYADGVLLVKGLVPGPISSIVTITRRGTNKKHQGLYKEPVVEEVIESKVEEIGPSIEEQEEMRKEAEANAEAEEKAEAAAAQVANQSAVNSEVEDVKNVAPESVMEEDSGLKNEKKVESHESVSEANEHAKAAVESDNKKENEETTEAEKS